MDEQQVRRIIREELSELIKSDRYTFTKDIQMMDGRKILVGSSSGLKIGTSAFQVTDTKTGFFGATPVVRQAAVAVAPTGGTGIAAGGFVNATERDDAMTTLNGIRTALINIGIINS